MSNLYDYSVLGLSAEQMADNKLRTPEQTKLMKKMRRDARNGKLSTENMQLVVKPGATIAYHPTVTKTATTANNRLTIDQIIQMRTMTQQNINELAIAVDNAANIEELEELDTELEENNG